MVRMVTWTGDCASPKVTSLSTACFAVLLSATTTVSSHHRPDTPNHLLQLVRLTTTIIAIPSTDYSQSKTNSDHKGLQLIRGAGRAKVSSFPPQYSRPLPNLGPDPNTQSTLNTGQP